MKGANPQKYLKYGCKTVGFEAMLRLENNF